MRNRDLHKQVRVVYRACRRIYGKEKTQDECLKVFKVVFPELHKLKTSTEERAVVSQKVTDALLLIEHNWNPTHELKELVVKIINQLQMPFDWDKQELMQFYDDITPVAMRIRKLTPRECGRLQDVDDCDIDTIEASGLSNSAMYKLYGNSITVNVLFHLFRKLLIETEPDMVKGQPMQLSLF